MDSHPILNFTVISTALISLTTGYFLRGTYHDEEIENKVTEIEEEVGSLIERVKLLVSTNKKYDKIMTEIAYEILKFKDVNKNDHERIEAFVNSLTSRLQSINYLPPKE